MLNAPTFKTAAPNTGYRTYNDPERGLGSTPTTGPLASQWTPEAQGMQQALDFYSGLAGPQMAGLQQQSGLLAGQLGQTQAGYDIARGALQQGAAADLAKVNLGPEYDAITRGTIYRQMVGLNAADKLAYQMLGQQFKGFDLQNKEAWQNAQRGQWQNRSQGTAKGAVGSRGYNERMTNIQQDLANQLQNVGINREQARLTAVQGANSRAEQKAQLDDQNKMLDIKAKEYGIDKSKVAANLSEGLAKLGIDNVTNVNEILNMLNSNDIQQRALGEQIFREAIGNSGYFTTLPTNTAPVTNPVTESAVDQFLTRGATG